MTRSADSPKIPTRGVLAGPAVAIVTLLTAVLATLAAGVPFRDPGHAVAHRLALMGCVVALLVVLDACGRGAPASEAVKRMRGGPSDQAVKGEQCRTATP